MSNIKFSPNLFLGKQELDRFKKFIDEDGFRKIYLQNMLSFGLFNSSKNGLFDNFKVEQGTNVGTIKHAAGIAVDSNGQLIVRSAIDNIALTDDDAWYWVKIAHVKVNVEVGTVDIDASGNLTENGSSGTLFTEVLRGSPNNAIKISFPSAVTNTGEYEVLSVASNTSAILNGGAGVFGVETNLQYVITGSFSPDSTPTAGEKDIYEYDNTTFSIIAETALETAPTITTDIEFLIARVRRNGSTISIMDVRSRYIARNKADYNQALMDSSVNACIGVESIKYDHNYTPRDRNLVYTSWGMRSSNWTIDTAINRVTIVGGLGGRMKTTADFVDADFDGWRLYTENGKYTIIRTSALSAGQINLNLNSLDFSNFSNTSQQLLIVPNVEGILIKFIPDSGTSEEIVLSEHYFPINVDVAKIPVLPFADPTSSYVVKYKYKQGLEWGLDTLIPTDAVGYYNEGSFNDDGSNGTLVSVPYTQHATNGFITLTLANTAYINQISTVLQGDKLGVTIVTPDDSSPITVLTPTISDKDQWWVQSSGTFSLGVNHFIDLSISGVNDGNSFNIHFDGTFDLNGNTFKVVTGYVNAGNPGTTVLDLTQLILDIAPNKLVYKFIYDTGTSTWLYFIDKGNTDPQEVWTDLTLSNGWVSDTRTPQYMKDSIGFVHLRGNVKAAASTSAIISATGLPATYRPPTTVGSDISIFTVPSAYPNGGLYDLNYRIFIDGSTGEIAMHTTAYITAIKISFEGVLFDTRDF